jgi:hypothetical protein
MDELIDVDRRIDRLDENAAETIAGHFTHCHGDPTMFHDTEDGEGVVNVCTACFEAVLRAV